MNTEEAFVGVYVLGAALGLVPLEKGSLTGGNWTC